MRGRRTKVKVCGVCSAADADAAVRAGADAIGVVFADSPRRLTVQQAAEVLASVPPGVMRVGVFVDEDPAEVSRVAAEIGLDAVQLHGAETLGYCDAIDVRVIKSVRVRDRLDIARAGAYAGHAYAILLDTYVEGVAGGSGAVFDWSLARGMPGHVTRLALAGGLTPENVNEAVREVRPWMVDVSSGVESEPRVKDLGRVSDFIAAVTAADLEG